MHSYALMFNLHHLYMRVCCSIQILIMRNHILVYIYFTCIFIIHCFFLQMYIVQDRKIIS